MKELLHAVGVGLLTFTLLVILLPWAYKWAYSYIDWVLQR